MTHYKRLIRQSKQIVDFYNEHESVTKLREEFWGDYASLKRVLIENNVEIKTHKINVHKVIELVKKWWCLHKISKQLGCSIVWARQVIYRYNQETWSNLQAFASKENKSEKSIDNSEYLSRMITSLYKIKKKACESVSHLNESLRKDISDLYNEYFYSTKSYQEKYWKDKAIKEITKDYKKALKTKYWIKVS